MHPIYLDPPFLILYSPPFPKPIHKLSIALLSMGTPGKYDCSCDIWSCGVIMYTMLCCLVLWNLPGKQGPVDMRGTAYVIYCKC